MSATLVDSLGRPIPARRFPGPSRDSGAFRGSINNYRPRRTATQAGETAERTVTQARADDLYANDFAAKSAVDSVVTNAVGTGLRPQALLPFRLLGISKKEAYEIKEQMEWLWWEWTTQADAVGSMSFEDIQYLGLSSILRQGEMLQIPVRESPSASNDRTFSLCLQALSPQRLHTPADKLHDSSIRDGVHLSPSGKPLGYWIASPLRSALYAEPSPLTSAEYRYIPARIAHHPGTFHVFRHETEEQVRGTSSLATGVKLFRNLTDAIDYELLAQVLAASFPVFIEKEGGASSIPAEVLAKIRGEEFVDETGESRAFGELEPGGFMVGAPGEKPHVLESKRPSQNFLGFVELILRALGASVGLPYEVLFKDFSKTNYSSTRAALNEAWKLYLLYRVWFVRQYCQIVWSMVMEEGYLRGRLVLPARAKGFYEARRLWTCANWFGPSRGYVDPVKEVQATILKLQNHLMTHTKALAEDGEDFDDLVDSRLDEMERLGSLPAATGLSGKAFALGEKENKAKPREAEHADV